MPDEKKREYARMLYRRRNEQGLCPNCGHPRDRDGKLCTRCNDRNKEDHRYYKGIGYCPRCRKEKLFGSESYCPECLAKTNESTYKHRKELGEAYREYRRDYCRTIRAKRREQGLCPECGKKITGIYKVCDRCHYMETRRKPSNDYKKDKSITKKRMTEKVCTWCGAPRMEKSNLCSSCSEKYKKTHHLVEESEGVV